MHIWVTLPESNDTLFAREQLVESSLFVFLESSERAPRGASGRSFLGNLT